LASPLCLAVTNLDFDFTLVFAVTDLDFDFTLAFAVTNLDFDFTLVFSVPDLELLPSQIQTSTSSFSVTSFLLSS